MDTERKAAIRQSATETYKSLRATIKAAYKLAPFAVVVAALVLVAITWLTTLWAPLMTASAVILVLLVSVGIFAIRGNFGEAMLSLVGGLLTVFAFEWTPERYLAFSVAWVGFAILAILIASVKLAAHIEEIYRQAALRLAGPGPEFDTTERKLRAIGSSMPVRMLGPIERAQVIRVLAFRGLPIDLFLPCLNAVDALSVITKSDTKTIAIFLADFLLSFNPESAADAQAFVDTLSDVFSNSPVPPEEFFAAFEKSRRLLVSRSVPLLDFLEQLREALASGVAPDDVYHELRERFRDMPTHGTTNA